MCDTQLRALIVDDDIDDRNETAGVLALSTKYHFTVDYAATLTEATAHLHNKKFDIVLLDLGLPETSGLSTLHSVRATTSDIPIIVISDLNDEGSALAALSCGAQDYFIKGTLTADALVRSISYAIQRQKLLRELKKHETVLQRNQEMLESQNERLKALCDTAHKFVDNVSHEFRTPLTVIKEYASLMLDGIAGPIDEEQRRMLNIVGDRTNDLSNMVDDMLDISKMQSGLMGLVRSKCKINEVLNDVHPGLARKADIKGVRLEFFDEDESLELYCDPEKIGRVIINLTVNAIKFCGTPGLVQVRCKASQSSDDLVIEVADNGRGIDEEGLQNIFERFTQLDNDIRSSTKGFGLGLSICKELVHLNFGQMNVESELGQGSCFSFTVPLYRPQSILKRYLERIHVLQDPSKRVSLVEAHLDAKCHLDDANDVDAFLSYLLRSHDIIFRIDSTSWLFALHANEVELPQFSERANATLDDANRNRFKGPFPPIDWINVGTWHVSDADAIVHCAGERLRGLETIHG